MFFVTRDFDPQINGFPKRIVEHVCVKFGDANPASIYGISCRKNRQTNRQTDKTPTSSTAVLSNGPGPQASRGPQTALTNI